MEETNKIAALARGLPKYDGRDRSVFPSWKAKLRVHLTLGAPGIFKILQGRECPNPPGDADTVEASADIMLTIERWKIDNNYFYSILFLATNDGAQKLVERYEGKSIDDGAGDGRAAWLALVEKYNGISNAGRVASYEILHNSRLQPGQDPDIWLYAMDGARDRLHEHGEVISDHHLADRILKGLPDEYEHVRNCSYNQREFGLEDVKRTMRNIYADKLARSSSQGKSIAGRGVAMHAQGDSSGVQCFNCSEYGHYRNDCPQNNDKKKRGHNGRKKNTGGGGNGGGHNGGRGGRGGGGAGRGGGSGAGRGRGGGAKWCSLHNTTSHSDQECLKQKSNGNTGSANFANIYSPHQSESPVNTTVATTSAATGGYMGGYSFMASAAAEPAPQERPTEAREKELSGSETLGLFGALGGGGESTALMAMAEEYEDYGGFGNNGGSVKLLVDSGASEHYLDDRPGLRERLSDYVRLVEPREITTAGNHKLKGVATGTISGYIIDQTGVRQQVRLPVVVVPDIGRNLFSVPSATEQGATTIFALEESRIETNDFTIPLQQVGGRRDLYTFNIELGGVDLALHAEVNADQWHRRMGHINGRSLELLNKTDANGVRFSGGVSPCDVCAIGKSIQQPHPKKANLGITMPFQLVYTDLMGPISPPAMGGFKYVSKITDEFTKYKEIYLIKTKGEAVDTIQLYVQSVVAPLGFRIQGLRADRGTEYTGEALRKYCRQTAINLRYAAVNTPQQIGVSERDGRTLAGITRCLLADSGLPKFLWGELMFTAAYLANRTPHSALNMGTPYKALHGKEATLQHLRTIGSRAFVHIETHTKKLEDRSWEGRFCGYSQDTKAYRIYNPATHKVVESRNVVFIETPSKVVSPTINEPDNIDEMDNVGSISIGDGPEDDDMLRDVRDYTSRIDFNNDATYDHTIPIVQPRDPAIAEILTKIRGLTQADVLAGEGSPAAPADGVGGQQSPSDGVGGQQSPAGDGGGQQPAAGGGNGRQGGPAGGMASNSGGAAPQHQVTPALTRSGSRAASALLTTATLRGLQQLCLYTNTALPDMAHYMEMLTYAEYAYAATNVQLQRSEGEKVLIVPNTFKEAMALPEAARWKAASDKEMESLRAHKVYELVPITSIPPGQKAISSRWVYKIKADDSFKGRVVVQAWGQVSGRDCGGTFAPVCRIQSIRMVLATAAEKGWTVWQLDVQTAFLYADVEEDVWVKMVPGYEAKDEATGAPLVMKLLKSLYGLKQSPKNWHGIIDTFLVGIGFKALKSDPCVYIFNGTSGPTTVKQGLAKDDDSTVILTLYVDDVLLAGGNKATLEMLKGKLMSRFKMSDMGDVSRVLGMQVTRDIQAGSLVITQEDYTRGLLVKYGMQDCRPLGTPGYGKELSLMQPEKSLLDEEAKRRFQAIVGSAMYLSQVTRYDISYAVNQLARAMSKPSKVHMGAAKHLLRYLAGTVDFGITYKQGGFRLNAYSDANWGNNPDNGKSTSSYIMMMCNGPVSFKVGMQGLTAQSTMEAELVAGALAMREAVFCQGMMTELGFEEEFKCVPLHIDNTSALHVAGNQTYSSRAKHVALRYFYIREIIKEGHVSIHYIPTEKQLADLGTKFLNKQRHRFLIELIKNFQV